MACAIRERVCVGKGDVRGGAKGGSAKLNLTVSEVE